MKSEPEFDLRHLAAPEPMLRALVAADALAPGERLTVVTPMLPSPLLIELARSGYLTEHEPAAADDSVRVHILRPAYAETAA